VTHFDQQIIIDPSEMTGFYLYYEEEYDNYIFNFLDSIAHNYSRVLDIGANIGVYTVFFARRFKIVDAFEPDPKLVVSLNSNLEINRLKNVRVHEMCIGQKAGVVRFEPSGKSNTGIGHISENNARGIEVYCTTIDDFIGQNVIESILIKIDIEGAEWLAVQGAEKTLRELRYPLSILMEIHPKEITVFGGDVVRLKHMLEDSGFVVQAITPEGLKEIHNVNDYRFWWISSERKLNRQCL